MQHPDIIHTLTLNYILCLVCTHTHTRVQCTSHHTGSSTHTQRALFTHKHTLALRQSAKESSKERSASVAVRVCMCVCRSAVRSVHAAAAVCVLFSLCVRACVFCVSSHFGRVSIVKTLQRVHVIIVVPRIADPQSQLHNKNILSHTHVQSENPQSQEHACSRSIS